MTSKNKKIATEIEINAPRETVWKVLTDFENMHTWSSSFQNLEGDFKESGQVVTYFKIPLGRVISAKHTLIEFKEGFSFGWSDPLAFGVKDYHIFKLEELSEQKTKFIQTDHFHNGASCLMQLLMNNNAKKMYDKFNLELKERVESTLH